MLLTRHHGEGGYVEDSHGVADHTLSQRPQPAAPGVGALARPQRVAAGKLAVRVDLGLAARPVHQEASPTPGEVQDHGGRHPVPSCSHNHSRQAVLFPTALTDQIFEPFFFFSPAFSHSGDKVRCSPSQLVVAKDQPDEEEKRRKRRRRLGVDLLKGKYELGGCTHIIKLGVEEKKKKGIKEKTGRYR